MVKQQSVLITDEHFHMLFHEFITFLFVFFTHIEVLCFFLQRVGELLYIKNVYMYILKKGI